MPARVETIAAYLASLAKFGLKASTIMRRRAAIAYMHRAAGLEPPTTSAAAKAVLAGIRRSIGTAVTRKAPITVKAVRAMLEEMPEGGTSDGLEGTVTMVSTHDKIGCSWQRAASPTPQHAASKTALLWPKWARTLVQRLFFSQH